LDKGGRSYVPGVRIRRLGIWTIKISELISGLGIGILRPAGLVRFRWIEALHVPGFRIKIWAVQPIQGKAVAKRHKDQYMQ